MDKFNVAELLSRISGCSCLNGYPADRVNSKEKPLRSRNSRGHSAADGARHEFAQAFLTRSVSMLERVTSSASTEALKSALSSPTDDIGGVASLWSDLAPYGVDLSAADPFVEAMARGAGIKRNLLETRFTSLDRTILRNAQTDDRGLLRSQPKLKPHVLARLVVLSRMGLAKPDDQGTWVLKPDMEQVLRAMQRARDRQNTFRAR